MDMIRPVFQRQRFDNPPLLTTTQSVIASSGTTTVTVQPPPGVTYSVNYLQLMCSVAGGAAAATMKILFNKSGTTLTLKEKLTGLADGDTISFGSFGNGPLLLTNANYIQFQIVITGYSSQWTFDSFASYTVV